AQCVDCHWVVIVHHNSSYQSDSQACHEKTIARMNQNISISYKSRKAKDKTLFMLVCLCSAIAMVPLFFIIWDVISKGYKNFNFRLFTEVTPSSMDALMATTNGEPIPGGIINGITGSLLIVGLAIL